MRIAIPPHYGRNMLGIMDETGVLKYGQVFIQYSESTTYDNDNLKTLKGTVVVTKNPCMHPGDVRKLEAIDVPALRHIKDCIVFPSRGHRPHPNEMAGSDLDGDEFVAIWHPDLIFPGSNYEAMHFPTYEDERVPGVIGVPEMLKFFCKYIMNDNIGVFANAHLAWADQHPKGIFSDVCMSIARKYPFVLDFAKTGKTLNLKREERTKQYPDFMRKGNMCDSYCSQRVLGLLYRTSRHFEVCVDKISGVPSNWKCDPYLEYPGWEIYKSVAEVHRSSYCSKVQHILNKFGIHSEVEALSGYVKGQLYNQSRQERENAVATVRKYILSLMQKYRDIFIEEMKEELKQCSSDCDKDRIKYERASAWYMVTYQNDSCHLLSFPWILSDILAEMRLKCLQLKNGQLENVRDAVLGYLDVRVTNNFLGTSYEIDTRDHCFCVNAGKHIMENWFHHMKFNLNSRNVVCTHCYGRIMAHFLNTEKVKCCCNMMKTASCSPLKFCVCLLMFYCDRMHGDETLGKCEGSCGGFNIAHLQALALQTLANLVVTRNMSYLGPSMAEVDSKVIAEDGSMADVEGDMVRVPVRSPGAQKFVSFYMHDVKEYLKKQSGVTKIFIEPEQDIRNNCYLLVSSEGRDWQRWNLECLVLDPHLFQKLQEVIKK